MNEQQNRTVTTKSRTVPIKDKELWSVRDMCQLWGVNRSSVMDMVKRRLFPEPMHVGPKGGKLAWPRRLMQQWLDDGCPDPTNWTYTPRLIPQLDALVRQRLIELRRLDEAIAKANLQVKYQ